MSLVLSGLFFKLFFMTLGFLVKENSASYHYSPNGTKGADFISKHQHRQPYQDCSLHCVGNTERLTCKFFTACDKLFLLLLLRLVICSQSNTLFLFCFILLKDTVLTGKLFCKFLKETVEATAKPSIVDIHGKSIGVCLQKVINWCKFQWRNHWDCELLVFNSWGVSNAHGGCLQVEISL